MTASLARLRFSLFGRSSGRAVRTGPLLAPAVSVLLIWMIVPLVMTLWFSFQYYNLVNPETTGFAGVV